MDRPCAAFWLLIASLASPALAAETGEEAPPWTVEAPGAAGARFGLGLDLFFEHQESLRITFQEQALRSLDPSTGNEVSTVVRTDPGLLNRKFDLRWDLTGVGIQPAVAVPFPRALGIYPTLVLQAASADVSLDFLDRNRPEDSSSLDGRGSLFGAGLDLTRAFCEGCPWFAGLSFFSQQIPSFNVNRSPPFGLEGFEILDDEVQLRRDVQEVSTRVGYGFSGHRIVSYVGVRHLRTDVEIEDRLRYRDPFLVETSLSSRTKLESEVTLASAGVEARLGPRLFGRLETSVGEEDWGAFFRVVYLGQEKESDEGLTQRDLRRLEEIASVVGPRIAEIHARFLADWKKLTVVEGPDGQPAYLVRELLALLDRTERAILGVLVDYPDLEALGDWVRDEFREARILGGLASVGATATRVAAVGMLQLPPDRSTSEGGKVFSKVNQSVGDLKSSALAGFHVRITFLVESIPGEKPLGDDASLTVFRRRSKRGAKETTLGGKGLSPGGRRDMRVGSYSWVLKVDPRSKLDCDGNQGGPAVDCPFDMVRDPCVTITCNSKRCRLAQGVGCI